MRGETLRKHPDPHIRGISIHSPHARGDVLKPFLYALSERFQSTPLMRGETNRADAAAVFRIFQSTPLMRGETNRADAAAVFRIFQSTPLMRGETCTCFMIAARATAFQSTPLMRGETFVRTWAVSRFSFQSTPLMRGETKLVKYNHVHVRISIHSPHARGDSIASISALIWSHFNPLPSCEGRPDQRMLFYAPFEFQSTPLMRGETIRVYCHLPDIHISIHSPHARGDPFARLNKDLG